MVIERPDQHSDDDLVLKIRDLGPSRASTPISFSVLSRPDCGAGGIHPLVRIHIIVRPAYKIDPNGISDN